MSSLSQNKINWSDMPFMVFVGSIILSFVGVIIYIIYSIFFN